MQEGMCISITYEILKANKPVADPDPVITGGRPQKTVFGPFGPHFDLKMRGAPGPPGPSPESSTANRGLD